MTYLVRRFCFDTSDPQHRSVQIRGLTLEQAQEWCQSPETSSRTASEQALAAAGIDGPWFDGYDEE